MKKFVYIACPYTKGDVALNVCTAMDFFDYLADLDVIPFNPLLYHFQHMHTQRDYDFWMEIDLAWIDKCDAVFRVLGESKGADRECEYARKKGIPIFTDLNSFEAWSKR